MMTFDSSEDSVRTLLRRLPCSDMCAQCHPLWHSPSIVKESASRCIQPYGSVEDAEKAATVSVKLQVSH